MVNPKHSEARRRSWVTRKERYGAAGASRKPHRVKRETPPTPRQIRELVVHNAAIEQAAKVAEAAMLGTVGGHFIAAEIRKLLRAP